MTSTDADPTLEEAERDAREETSRPGRGYCEIVDTGHVRVLLAELDRLRELEHSQP